MIADHARRLSALLTREHCLIGASLARVSLGIWALYFYLLHFPVRQSLWGPQGFWPLDRYLSERALFSIFQLSPAPLVFDLLYLSGIVVAFCFTVGWQTRPMSLLHWVMTVSLQERNFFITDGGDNLMRLVLLFFILVDGGAFFSVDARRRRLRRPVLAMARAAAHNAGVLLIIVQLSLLYMSTGLYKTMGTVWQNGTALYYILRVGEFSRPGVAEFVYRNPFLVVAGTYGTVLFEVLFAPLLINRWTRYGVLLAGVGFHLAVGLLMGLITFSWSMLSVYPLLITDGEYRALAQRVRAALSVTVLYDGWCPLCTRSVRWLQRLDLTGLAAYVSFREPEILERYGIDAGRAERRILSVDRRGRVAEGIDVLLQLAVRSVLLWPAVPVLLLGKITGGQRFYDTLASRRLVIVPGYCGAHCAVRQEGSPGS